MCQENSNTTLQNRQFPTNQTNTFDFIKKNTLKDQITSEMKPLSYSTKTSFWKWANTTRVNMIAFGSDNPFSRNKNLILQIILIILSFNCSMFFFVTVAIGLGKYVFRFLIMLISTPPQQEQKHPENLLRIFQTTHSEQTSLFMYYLIFKKRMEQRNNFRSSTS